MNSEGMIREIDDQIVALLRISEGHVSGEELCRRLSVSRSAIWKHVEKLRELGYDIEASPHLGYRLRRAPDKMLPLEVGLGLPVAVVGRRIVSYETTGSTMDVAREAGQSGAPEGLVVFAETQTKGRGRLGRVWSSPKGKGITCSILLRPSIPPAEAGRLTLLASVALARALSRGHALAPEIRWPNDLLIRGRKIAGILTEMQGEQDRVSFVVVGIGLNVNASLSDLPEGATSIREEAGGTVSRVETAREILTEFDHDYARLRRGGGEEILKEWRTLSQTLGRRVHVQCHGRRIEGEALDIDAYGALLIRLDNGFTEPVHAGDVLTLR